MDKDEFCSRFTNCKIEDLSNSLRRAEMMSEISTERGPLEDVLLSYFITFNTGNVLRDHLFPLVDALMDREARNIKKEQDTRMKQLKTSRRTWCKCPTCDCVFENPITLTCGHTLCQYCIQRKSETICGGSSTTDRLDGNMTFCPLCGNQSNNLEALSVNIVLSDIIRKQFPEKAKHAQAKKLGKSHLLSRSPKEAVESFSVALHIFPNDYDCLCLRSDAYSHLKLYYLALRDANNACSLRPDLPDAFLKKAETLTRMKKFDDAVLGFLRCAALAPSKSRRNELTESLFRLFTSPDVSRLEQKIIARKLANTEEQLEIGVEHTNSSSEERNSDEHVSNDTSHGEQKVNIDVNELQCSICSRLLFHPITTECGHTFCQECMKESLEYGPKCPRCGKTLNDSTEKKRSITAVLDDLLRTHLETQYKEREEMHAKKVEMWTRIGIEQSVEIPILVGTIAMPQERVRLTLFHPCHRVMVRRCVEWGSRMFGMCLPKVEKGFSDYGTVVEIQATESFPGGKLVVKAIPKQRFRVLSRGVMDGCPAAKVEWLEDAKINDSETILHLKWRNSMSHVMLKKWLGTLPLDEKACIESALGPMPPCESHMLLSPNGPPWLWWAMAAVPLPPQEKLRILEMPSVVDRLQNIHKFLGAMLESSKERR